MVTMEKTQQRTMIRHSFIQNNINQRLSFSFRQRITFNIFLQNINTKTIDLYFGFTFSNYFCVLFIHYSNKLPE